MAEKRMFARKVAESARFLKMPSSSQNLYFHLGINADDDGIVEAYTVLNLINSNEDDYRVLQGKGFVIKLNEDLVSYIVHWRMNNYIRPDRKTDSIYIDLLLEVYPEADVLEKKERSDRKGKAKILIAETSGQSMDRQWTGESSVDKNSIDKNSIEEYKATLGKEKLTFIDYNSLKQKYTKKLVDMVLKRIIEHPYLNCLNINTIEQWCEEAKKRKLNFNYSTQNKFNNFEQREYNFEELEKQLFNQSSVEDLGGA